jgi:hypothetical protein
MGFGGRDEDGPYLGFSPNTVQKSDAHPHRNAPLPNRTLSAKLCLKNFQTTGEEQTYAGRLCRWRTGCWS